MTEATATNLWGGVPGVEAMVLWEPLRATFAAAVTFLTNVWGGAATQTAL